MHNWLIKHAVTCHILKVNNESYTLLLPYPHQVQNLEAMSEAKIVMDNKNLNFTLCLLFFFVFWMLKKQQCKRKERPGGTSRKMVGIEQIEVGLAWNELKWLAEDRRRWKKFADALSSQEGNEWKKTYLSCNKYKIQNLHILISCNNTRICEVIILLI